MIRRKRDETGQSLVEFALVLPVLLILLVGIVEIGSAFNSYLTVLDSSRDGARLGANGHATDTEIRNLVDADMGRLTDPFDPAGDINISRNTMPGDASVRVTVCYDHALMLGLPMLFLENPLRMCTSTTMRALELN